MKNYKRVALGEGKMVNVRLAIFACILACLLLVPAALAAPPAQITVQGRLTNTTTLGAMYGTYSVNFSLWSASSGGTMYFNQTQSVTTDLSGLYAAVLTGIPLDFANQYYLGVKVASDAEMTPRMNLTAVPYAFMAMNLSCAACVPVIAGLGIGATPSFPVGFGTGLGNKIGLYDAGSGAGYGFGVQSNLLQIFANTATDRVGIGYGNSASFTEALSVKGANVGIGTTSPNNTLIVVGTANITGAATLGGALTLNNAAVNIPNNLNVDSGVFYIDSTNNFVGINTTTPHSALDVNGVITVDTTTGTNHTIYNDASNDLNIKAGSGGDVIIRVG